MAFTSFSFKLMVFNFILIIIILFYLHKLVVTNSLLQIITQYKTKGFFYKGLGGMSNIILGYYSCVYLSILMNRYFRMNYISILGKYYVMPKFFFANVSFKNIYVLNENKLIKQYLQLENKTNVLLSTCHDILENIIPLCILNITKCIFINLKSKNYIHEIYKLRKKLITELLIPNRKLEDIYSKFRNNNRGFLIGIHIRTSIYSDFKEKSNRFYNNKTEQKYFYAIDHVIKKYKNKNKILYIISDSSIIKYKFLKSYERFRYKNFYSYNTTISHNLNDFSIIEQYILSKCNVIIGSCSSTFTLVSVFRYLNSYYAIEGVKYSSRGIINGKCGYKLDYNHILF